MLIQKQYCLAQEGNANTTMFFNIEEEKETNLDFSQGTVKALQIHSVHNHWWSTINKII